MNRPLIAVIAVMACIVSATVWLAGSDSESPLPNLPSLDQETAASETETAKTVTSKLRSGTTEPSNAADLKRERVPAETKAVVTIELRGRVVDSHARPVDDAVLCFRRAKPRNSNYRVMGSRSIRKEKNSSASTTTGRDGSFELSIGQGETGYLYLAESSDRRLATKHSILSVPGYQHQHDLGDLESELAARISGVVLGPNGSPVREAKVEIDEVKSFSLGGGNTTETTADGRFSRGGLKAGKYRVRVAAKGLVPHSAELVLEHAERIDDHEIKMIIGQTVSGTVVDDRGQAVTGAKVAVYRMRHYGSGIEMPKIDTRGAVETDASGRFVLPGLAGSEVKFRVSAEGHERVERKGIVVGGNDIVVKLDRQSSIRGRLSFADGQAIAGSKVFAQPVKTSKTKLEVNIFQARGLFTPRSAVKTDADGNFELKNIKPGSVEVYARGDLHLEIKSAVIQLRKGDLVTDIELIPDAGASLTVTVVDEMGESIQGVKVEVKTAISPSRSQNSSKIERRFTEMMRQRGGRTVGTGKTDANGIVLIGGLPPAAVEVQAAHGDFVKAKPSTVHLSKSKELAVALVLKSGGYLQVSVTNVHAEAIAEAEFDVEGPIDQKSKRHHGGKTDGEGGAKIGPLVDGMYKVVLKVPARELSLGGRVLFGNFGGNQYLKSSSIEVEIKQGKVTNAALTMPVLTRLHGIIEDFSGPIMDADIRLVKTSKKARGGLGGPSAKSDRLGRFEISNLKAGEWTVWYGKKNAIVKHRTNVLIPEAQEEQRLDLLVTGGTIRLEVRNSAVALHAQ